MPCETCRAPARGQSPRNSPQRLNRYVNPDAAMNSANWCSSEPAESQPSPSVASCQAPSFLVIDRSHSKLCCKPELVGELFQLIPGLILDIDAVCSAFLFAPKFHLTGIEDAAAAFRRRR